MGAPQIGSLMSLIQVMRIVSPNLWGWVAAHSALYVYYSLCLERIGYGKPVIGWLAVLVIAQLLHAATFAAHHSASVITMQRWFAGPLQARGQALYISIGYGVGGSLGGLFMALCWDRLGPHAVYFAAAALCVAGAGAAALSSRWQHA